MVYLPKIFEFPTVVDTVLDLKRITRYPESDSPSSWRPLPRLEGLQKKGILTFVEVQVREERDHSKVHRLPTLLDAQKLSNFLVLVLREPLHP